MGRSKKKKKKLKKGKKSSKKKVSRKKQVKKAKVAKAVFLDSNRNWLLGLALVIGLLTFAAYYNSLDNQFVDWDDYTYVIENNLVRSQDDIGGVTVVKNRAHKGIGVGEYTTTIGDIFSRPVSLNYHPLTILTMRWNNNACKDCMNGISAYPFILWNVILHILNSILLLFLMYWMTGKNIWASAVVAAIFALHPMHVESVAWVSERKDVLYTFFFLGGLMTYVKYLTTQKKSWLIATFALFVLSCLSKAMAVVFPLVMLLLYFWNDKSKDNFESIKKTLQPKVLMHTIPFFVVSLFFGMMASKVQSGENFLGLLQVASDTSVAINEFDTFTLLQRFQFAGYGFLQYIIRFFFPHDMSAFHAYPTDDEYKANMLMQLSPILVAFIFAAAIYSLKWTKSIATGIAFYFITVVLVLQFISVGAVIMADRYTYLPYIGLSFIIVMLIVEYIPKNMQRPAFGVLGVFCLALMYMTTQQVDTWEDSETLWTNVIEIHKYEDGRLHQNMEQPLSVRGNYYGKKAEYSVVIQNNQEKQKAYINKAFQDFQMAAKLGSKRPSVYEGLGNTHGMRREFDKALESYSKALQLDPTHGTAYFNRGVTYSNLRQHRKAIADYTKAIQYAPSKANMARINRGISYAETGQRQAAIQDFQMVLQQQPNNQMAKKYLNQLMK